MKKLIFLICILLITGCSSIRTETKTEPPLDIAFRQVWCCCQTEYGQCCGWTTVCPGFVPGCYCK